MLVQIAKSPTEFLKKAVRRAINVSQLWKKRLGDWVINAYIGCQHG